MPLRPAAAACALALALLTSLGDAFAHEGHDHAAPSPLVTPAPASGPRAEAASSRFELVALPRGEVLVLYLDRFATNAPVLEAAVSVETPNGRVAAAPTPDGTYRLAAPWLGRAGHHDLSVSVTEAGETDVLDLALDIPAPAPTAAPASSETAADALRAHLARQNPLATAAGGFILGLATVLLMRGRRLVPTLAMIAVTATLLIGTAVAHEGHDHGAAPVQAGGAGGMALAAPLPGERAARLEDGSVFVPKATQRLLALRTTMVAPEIVARTLELPGRVVPDPNASGVVQSSVGGRLAAPEGGFPRLGTRVRRGAVLATVTPPVQAVDVSDMRQRQGELDQQIAIVARRVARFERLAPTGALAQTQLDDARSELEGLRDRRAALDRVRGEPEALVAPVDGVIAETNVAAGAMAVPGSVLFRIVEPGRLWIEALSFETPEDDAPASARLGDGRILALSPRGIGLADRNQAVPVQFAVEGDTTGLRLGQFVTVLTSAVGERRGLPVPRGSVLRSEGTTRIYEHVGAERFVGRPVRAEPLDAERMLIAEGLEPGRRVVVEGVELLDQVR
ncbi:efflux RND transporter periplasmic adaptor subunit [Methylobacterium iners]|uniref:RND transporter n=1 Tax=Methylobacterium iners TaxID=418707 RepID=A0ABQ4S1G0_9HYPH|nr:HlyD family efflux transporter periplasmic adaptor subunit [Methylobacterium iners]GJD96953.1 hypothetical protein OCOJLMKI_4181 [Methylobacterium iners]